METEGEGAVSGDVSVLDDLIARMRAYADAKDAERGGVQKEGTALLREAASALEVFNVEAEHE
jgi:hypothetical protein